MKHFQMAAALLGILFAGRALAQTASPGARSIAMGGTFVASESDAGALWGNPAALGQCALGCGLLFGGGIATDENRFANRLRDDFADVDPATVSGERLARLQDELRSFQKSGTGTIASGSAGAAYAIRGFAVGVGGTAMTGAYPEIELAGTGAAIVPSLESRVVLKGLETREVRLGYAGSFFGLTLGADVRYVQGRTYFLSETLAQAAESPVSLSRDALKKNEVRTNRFAVDVGALYEPIPKLRLGAVAQNVNEPKFAVFNGSEARLPRTLRVGAAFAPLSWDGIVVSADADLRKTTTLVPGLSSQRVAAGAQIYFFRVGAFRDLEAVDPHWAYTAGFQLSAHFVSFGISGVYSTQKRDAGAAVEVKVKL